MVLVFAGECTGSRPVSLHLSLCVQLSSQRCSVSALTDDTKATERSKKLNQITLNPHVEWDYPRKACFLLNFAGYCYTTE